MDNYDTLNSELLDENEKWINLNSPVSLRKIQDSEPNEDGNGKKPVRRRGISLPVLTFQLFVTLSILIFLFVSKSFFPQLFHSTMNVYEKEMNREMISDGDFYSRDYSQFFSSSPDEA